jgi:hypothetical protein
MRSKVSNQSPPIPAIFNIRGISRGNYQLVKPSMVKPRVKLLDFDGLMAGKKITFVTHSIFFIFIATRNFLQGKNFFLDLKKFEKNSGWVAMV